MTVQQTQKFKPRKKCPNESSLYNFRNMFSNPIKRNGDASLKPHFSCTVQRYVPYSVEDKA